MRLLSRSSLDAEICPFAFFVVLRHHKVSDAAHC